MKIIRPAAINSSPSLVILMVGGLVGTILALATLYTAPVFGAPLLDMPRTVGGAFTADPAIALGVGALLIMVLTAVILPVGSQAGWVLMRGGTRGLPIQAGVLAVTHWAVLGAIMGLAGALGQWSGPAGAGWMGLGAGLAGLLVFGVASAAYGIAVAVVAWMEQGVSAFDAVGWHGFSHAASGPLELGAHRASPVSAPDGGETPWRGPARSRP